MPDLSQLYNDEYERGQIDQRSRSNGSLTEALGGFAANMLVAGLLITGAREGGPWIGGIVKNAGAMIKKNLFKGAFGESLNKTISSYVNYNNSLQSGEMIKGLFDTKVYSKWKETWDAEEKLIRTRALGPYVTNFKNAERTIDRVSNFYTNKFSDFLKPEQLTNRLAGKAVSSVSRFAADVGLFYASDHILNITRNDPTSEKPGLFNIPAHVKGYFKYAAQVGPGIMMFNMLGPGYKLVKQPVQDVLVKASEMSGFQGFIGGTLNKIASKIPNMSGVVKGAAAAYTGLANLGPRIYNLRNSVNVAREEFIKTYQRSTGEQLLSKSSITEAAIGEINRAPNLLRQHKGKALMEWMKGYSPTPVPSFTERFLGLKRATMSTSDINFALQNIKGFKKDDKNFFKNLLDNVSRRGVPLLDKGIYKTVHGSEVDLRNIMPGNMMRNLIGGLGELLQLGPIPGFSGKIPLLPLFRIETLAQHKPLIQYIRPGGALETGQLGYGVTNANGLHVAGDSGNFFINGALYDVGGNGTLQRITPKGTKFKLTAESRNSMDVLIMKNRVGLGGSEYDNLRGRMKHEAKGVFGKIGEFLDIKKFKDEGIFSYLFGIVNKYFSNKSPKTLFEVGSMIDSDMTGNRHMITSYLNSVSNIYKRSTGYVSSLFKSDPKILEQFGVDVYMTPRELRKSVLGRYKDIVDMSDKSGTNLLKQYDIKMMLDQSSTDAELTTMHRIAGRASDGTNLTVRDRFFEFLGADNLRRKGNFLGQQQALDEMLIGLKKGGRINDTQESAIRVWSHRHQVEDALKNIPQEGLYDHKQFKLISGIVNDYKKNYETVTEKLYTPLSSWTPKEEIDENIDLLIKKATGNVQGHYTGFVMTPADFNTVAKFPKEGAGFLHGLISQSTTRDVGVGNVWSDRIWYRSGRLLDFFGLGLDMTKYKTGSDYLFRGIIGRRILPMVGVMSAYPYVDKALFDMNPMFDGTIFDEGLGMAAADTAVKARMMVSNVNDFLGITSAAKYTEGLMPGFIDSPLMRAMRGTIVPLLGGAKIGAALAGSPYGAGLGMLAGAGLGAFQGFGAFDLTKSHEELADIYSGREEIPVRKGRWWMLSSGNYEGSRIQYFRPNWYARMKSQYKSTPDGMGSPLEQLIHKPLPFLNVNPLGMAFSPNHYSYAHYYSQPYPMTGSAFEDFPMFGPILGATVGKMITPPQNMHEQELESFMGKNGVVSYNQGGRSDVSFNGRGSLSYFNPQTTDSGIPKVGRTTDTSHMIDQQLYNMTEYTGLWGFGLETMMNKLTGFNQPFEGQDIMKNSSEMTSIRRSYWDLNLGDPFGATELFRRYLPKQRTQVNYFNPLVNVMPSWMPNQFHVGNPYAAIPEGELLLPGTGYESAHDVRMDFPISAEFLGLNIEDTARAMLGLYPHANKYTSRPGDIDRKNREIKAAGTVYDPYHNISGTHDGVIRRGRMFGIQKIKELSNDELDGFIGPTNSDLSEMNFYMRHAGAQFGGLAYTFNGQPVMTVPVKYSEERYLRDISVVREARSYASELLEKGVGFGGESYSHIDRLKILANVAPWSEEFKMEDEVVKMQIKAGYPIADQYKKAKKTKKARMMNEELFPYRFAGKVFDPDPSFSNLSLNENIKTADQYSFIERVIGSGWERIAHLNTPVNSKFLHIRSPREAYERETLYGREIKLWSHPMTHFMDAYSRGFMSKTTPFQGSVAGAMAGTLLGGPGFGTGIGAAAGAIYGGLHGVYREITGTTYIPGTIREGREVNRFFDQMSYTKNMMLYEATGDENYMEEAKSTMAGLVPGDHSRQSWGHMFRATPPQEKPYIMAFLHEQDPEERKRILDLVPEEVGDMLSQKWGTIDRGTTSNYVAAGATMPMPSPEWAGWSPAVSLDDIKLKAVQDKGLEEHDFSLGWYDQMHRVNNSPWLERISVEMGRPNTSSKAVVYNQAMPELRRTVEVALRQLGISADITVTPATGVNNIRIINV